MQNAASLAQGPRRARSKKPVGAQGLAVTVSGFVTGACPAAPELALMSTTVCCGTEVAALIVATPPPLAHPGVMLGCPMTDATAGLLLVTWMGSPCGAGSACAGAMCVRVTSMKDTPPGAMLAGVSVKEAMAGGGGAVPPGCKVTVVALETTWREKPDAVVKERFVQVRTGVAELTTAVGMLKLTDELAPGTSSTLQKARAAIRSPRSIFMLSIAPLAWGSLSVTVAVTSFPPAVLAGVTVRGAAPL